MAAPEQNRCKVALVLSIFKGENFVCKNSSGIRCQIEAKCFGKTLESGVTHIQSCNTEPAFNSQLAWLFTRKELSEMRVNKEIVKVRCLMLNDKHPVELGYSVLYVKDALRLARNEEIDPSKAKSYPVLGTTAAWKDYHPRLCMQLHLEERHSEERESKCSIGSAKNPMSTKSPVKIKGEVDQNWNYRESSSYFPSSKPLPNRAESVEKPGQLFDWRMNEDDGYFELGEIGDKDDLYILNITIISSSYLHLLWNGRSPKKASGDDYIWQVKYKAYGREIKSDPFPLSHEDDDSRRTFIGDKATARIRASGALFYEYLLASALQFHVVRYQIGPNNELVNEEVMGISFADLRDLAKPDVIELKTTLEILSEWGLPKVVSGLEKPEVRVVFQLEAIPEYFTLTHQALNPSTNGFHLSEEKLNEDKYATSHHEDEPPSSKKESCGRQEKEMKSIVEEIAALELKIQEDGRFKQKENFCNMPSEESKSSERTPKEKDFQHEYQAVDNIEEKSPLKSTISSSHAIDSPDSSNGNSWKGVALSTASSESESPEASDNVDISSESESSSSDKENLGSRLPLSGEFNITIVLTEFFTKNQSGNACKYPIMLSYLHPRFGIVKDPIVFTSTPNTEKNSQKGNQCQFMKVENGKHSCKVSIPKFSDKIINEPLTVEFSKHRRNGVENPFAFSLIPVGSAFLKPPKKNGQWCDSGVVEVMKSTSNMKIGKLHYSVDITTLSTTQQRLIKPSFHSDSEDVVDARSVKVSPLIEPNLVFKTVEELASWKAEQEREFTEKNDRKRNAYLKILADEAAKRDKEREMMTSVKLNELKKKEKELSIWSRKLEDKENKLKMLELEIASSTQKLTLDQANTFESTKLSVRRIQEECQMELASVQRRNAEYAAEVDKLKGRVALLERKLEEKEELICKLKLERHDRPDARISEKLKLLEQENKLLRKQASEIEQSRDQYKKQSQTLCHKLSRLQEERDKELKDENENLRLQILASKEHKELKKERQAVVDLSQTIRKLQISNDQKTKTMDSPDGRKHRRNAAGDEASREQEIARLTKHRNGLLNTGAYTQYDLVIKELERKIVALAQSDSIKS